MRKRTIRLGPFELQSPLGHGGMGEVWWGVHVGPWGKPLPVAVKLLTTDATRRAEWRAAFRNEVRSAAALVHPHIVMVYDHGEVDEQAAAASVGRLRPGTPFLAMEYLGGGTLTPLCGAIPWASVKEVLLGLLDALAHAHARGVLHRDIKPGNVLLDRAAPGEDPVRGAKLSDFGLAHALEDPTDQGVGADAGTPAYMAPEQFRGRWRDYGPWTDLYAVGCLAHYLVCGVPPFGPGRTFTQREQDHLFRPLPSLRPELGVPEGFESWLRILLEKDPTGRYQRAADAAWGLLQLGEPAGVQATRPRGLSRLAHLTAEPSPAPSAPRLPPLPPTWRSSGIQQRSALLAGAGLGLYGLRTIPLVDRDEVRDALWGALREVREEPGPAVVSLEGPSGFGKSRLADWLCERAHEVGSATVLKAFHGATPGPGLGLAPMVARFLRVVGLGRDAVHERVLGLIGAHGIRAGDEWLAMAEWLVQAAEVRPSSGRVLRFESAEERYATLLHLVEILARPRPVVIWLDDVECGLDALHLASHVCRSRTRARVLFVLTAAEERLAERPLATQALRDLLQCSRARRLTVGPLPQEHRPALVRELLGLEGDLARRVEARTAGNPLFAVQLVGEWVQRGLLVPGTHGFRLVEGVDLELPDDLHQVWVDRVERLLAGRPEADAQALELAAVLGRTVDEEEWSEVCRRSGIAHTGDLVDALLAQRLAESGERRSAASWSFVRPMLRESVERRAGDHGRLQSHHRVCAQLLRERVGPRSDERLGRHLLAAGEAEAALEPLLGGIDRCIDSGDYTVAESLLADRERALSELSVPTSDPRWGQGWLRGFRIARWRSDFGEAETRLDRLEGAAREHGWERLVARAQGSRGRLARIRGDLDRALELLEDAEQRAVDLGERAILAELRWDRSEVLNELGRLESAEQTVNLALKDYEHLGDGVGVARCWQALGEVGKNRGRYDEAAELLQWSRDLYQANGYRWGEASALNSLGDVRRYQGRVDEAVVLYRQAGALFRSIGSGSGVYPEHNLGLALLESERAAEALPVFRRTLERFEEQGSRGSMASAHLGIAVCAAWLGDWPLFERHLEQATSLFVETRTAEEDAARLALLAADLTERVGELGHTQRALALALIHWRAMQRDDEVRAVRERLREVREADGAG